jgi:hypothetical protein
VRRVRVNSEHPVDLHALGYLPHGNFFTATHFIDNVLMSIEQFPTVQAAARRKHVFVILMGNLPIYKPKSVIEKIASMKIQIALHPTYSLELVPLNFFLFGSMKQKFGGREFDDLDNLISAIRESFSLISRFVLRSVFNEWMTCLYLASVIRVAFFPRPKKRYIYFLDNLRAGAMLTRLLDILYRVLGNELHSISTSTYLALVLTQ